MIAQPTKKFSSARAKVQRARRHLEDLIKDVDAYTKSGAIAFEQRKVPNTNHIAYFLKTVTPVPVEMGTIVGDIVHNLRSALDIVIAEAVAANGANVTKDHGFPNALTRESLESQLQTKVRDVSPKLVKLIRRLKPYHGGNKNLNLLSELNNMDKHRSIIIPATTAVQIAVDYQMPGIFIGSDGSLHIGGTDPGGRPYGTGWVVPNGVPQVVPIGKETEIYRDTTGFPHEVQVGIALLFTPDVSDVREPIVTILQAQENYVERIIDLCEMAM